MTSRLSALLVWSLAAAAAVFWALRLFGTPLPVPPHAQLAEPGAVLAGELSRLLGAAPVAAAPAAVAAPDVAARFRLTGVVATRAARDPGGSAKPGLALISVDAKPARAYRVGEALESALVLHSVGLRSARLSAPDGSGGFVLELPPPTPAATGVPGQAAVSVPSAPMPGFTPPAPTPEPMAPFMAPGALPPGDIVPEGLPQDLRRRQLVR